MRKSSARQRKGRNSTASAPYEPQSSKSARPTKSAERTALRNRTYNRTIRLLKEREVAEGAWTKEQRTRANMYLCHLIDGEALGIPTPDEVRTAVRAALRQACDETGFTLPPQKPKPKRKKRR